MPAEIRTFLSADDFQPLDRRWGAQVRLGTKTLGAYGATRDEAIANLRLKLSTHLHTEVPAGLQGA